VPDTHGAGITATYSGDALYNGASGSYPCSAASGDVGGTVPATLALTLGAPLTFTLSTTQP
jgi:hypothetical protein